MVLEKAGQLFALRAETVIRERRIWERVILCEVPSAYVSRGSAQLPYLCCVWHPSQRRFMARGLKELTMHSLCVAYQNERWCHSGLWIARCWENSWTVTAAGKSLALASQYPFPLGRCPWQNRGGLGSAKLRCWQPCAVHAMESGRSANDRVPLQWQMSTDAVENSSKASGLARSNLSLF